MTAPAVRLTGVTLRYGTTTALDRVSVEVPAGATVGLIGADGVGKSSLLAAVAGTRRVQEGRVEVLGGDMARSLHRARVCPAIAFMPQGLGKNLYPALSVFENLDYFARLFGLEPSERTQRTGELLEATGLAPFAERPVGQLSGGMKQKLGLCCALVHDPALLVLDEPTTGVDPLSRRQFWQLVARIRAGRPELSVLVATAYIGEARGFDRLVAMDGGRVLAEGTAAELLASTRTTSLEAAFIALLPEARRSDFRVISRSRPPPTGEPEVAIEARALTRRFGAFVAVDGVDLSITRGEIFGFLGSNGCGKTTTMKMLTGLLPASEGEARIFGRRADARDTEGRRRVGYMSQGFSLYAELTVRQNLELHASLFDVPGEEIPRRISAMLAHFGLEHVEGRLPERLPLGQRQRLSLAVALIHRPDILILDEPTSGVDPVARDEFWELLVELARRERVTIFISTHLVNEAERCDRVSLMHAGRVLVTDTPDALKSRRGAATLEDAFIAYLEEAAAASPAPGRLAASRPPRASLAPPRRFAPSRVWTCARRETLELGRDPVRLTLAVLGSVLLLFIMGYGINMDVEDLPFAVLDRDDTATSHDYTLNIEGSRYFIARPPLAGHDELDQRMRSGELGVALEIPPGFARDVDRGRPVEIGVWVDGAMPSRGEAVRGYVQGLHAQWLAARARGPIGSAGPAPAASIEIRFRYNPDVKSLVAMVPAVIPLLLMLIPAMLAALSVVREKELGSILNFYVTPITPLEFLLGKQLPYVVLGALNWLILTGLAIGVFGIPFTGSFVTAATGALLYVMCATTLGLLISAFVRSQTAAIFGTAVLTLLPAISLSGMLHPVTSLEGLGALVGHVYPTTHFLTISRGTFCKGLAFADLSSAFFSLAIAVPLLVALATSFLSKQEA